MRDSIPRVNLGKAAPELYQAVTALDQLVANRLTTAGIAAGFSHLLRLRASQLNGCAFCLDMHAKQATIHGERPLRLYHLAAWRESTLFSPRERAALAWTEALTQLPPLGVPDDIYERVRGQLSEKELSDLTFAVMAINAWNRVNIAFRVVPGSLDKPYGLDKAKLA
jgi:AhpD family alkylhydroperoxidase